MQAAAEELRRWARHPVRRLSAPTPATAARQGTTGHDRQPALPQRRRAWCFRRLIRSLPTRNGRDRRGHLRQGAAGHDDGAGRHARPALRAGARRRDAAADEGEDAGKVQIDRRALRPRRDHACRRPPSWAAAPAPRRAAAASSSAPRPPRRWSARRWACRCRTRRSRRRASPSGSTWRGARRARVAAPRGARHHHAQTSSPTRRSATRWSCTRPSAAPPTCCCTSPPSPTPPGCAARRSTTGSTSTARCRGWSTCCPTARVDHPTVRVFLAGGVPEVMLHLRAAGPARRVGASP